MSTLPEHPPTPDGTRPMSRPPAWTDDPSRAVPERFGDFEVVSKLGEGAFGQVYLARQVSLGRHVALKVLRGECSGRGEGPLLAGLEHDHIVKVFSAFADPGSRVHGLCLQYVPGADLGIIIGRVFEGGRTPESGRALLDALDAVRKGDPVFDPAALRDREGLAADDYAQAVCRLGARLAEALAFAHARGILHCDIKPGNILMTPYGRPMLADFNVAFDRSRLAPEGQLFGGTVAYMAPEYRNAVFGKPGGAADERCDVYALGVVLHELTTGARPARAAARNAGGPPDASTAVLVPNEPPGDLDLGKLAGVPRELAAVIRRCLECDPARRYQTATDLAAALNGAWHLLAVQRALPRPSPVGRWVSAHPARALGLTAILPHLAAAGAQASYNAVEVQLNSVEKLALLGVATAYNLIVYPAWLVAAIWLVRRQVRGLRNLAHLSGPEVRAVRARVCRLAGQMARLGALGWLPGAVLFPAAIDVVAGPLRWQVYAPFAVSFALAGVVAVVFSHLGFQYVLFRAILPQLGDPDTHTPAQMAGEVRSLTAAFGPLVLLAYVGPLIGAVLLLQTDGYTTLGFRLLVVMLFVLAAFPERIVRRLRELAAVWLNEGSSK